MSCYRIWKFFKGKVISVIKKNILFIFTHLSRAHYVKEKFERLYIDLAQREIFDPNFKGTIQVSSRLMEAVIKVTDGQAFYRVLKNYRLNVEAIGMCFPPNHKFFEVFSEFTNRLIDAGILPRLVRLSYEWKENRFKHLLYKGPKKLTMDDLHFGFLICAASLGFSIMAFCVECIPSVLRKCKAFWLRKVRTRNKQHAKKTSSRN